EDGINALPVSGMIEGADFIALSGLIAIMSDPVTILNEPAVVMNIGIKESAPEKEPAMMPGTSEIIRRSRVVGW
uniref:hypothetical protein n=1 Tax=Ferrovum sp. TaxID=2609467 RepID=UPI002616E028